MEVTAPRADEVKFIMHHWDLFHRREAVDDRMNNLYPPMYRMQVAARGMGLGEYYTMSVPVGTRNEDIERIIDNGIQVRNRNYV